jgi:hypothetical protein
MKSSAEAATLSGKITNYSDVAWYDSNNVHIPCYEEEDYSDYGYPGFGILAISLDRTYTDEDYVKLGSSFFIGKVDTQDIEDGYGDYFALETFETPGKYRMVLPSGDIGLCLYTFYESTTEVPGGGCAILHDWKRLNLSKGDVRSDVNFTAQTENPGSLEGSLIVPSGYDSFPEDWCYVYAAREANPIAMPIKDAIAFSGYSTSYKFKNLPAGTYTLTAYARNLASVRYQKVTVAAGSTATQNITFSAGGVLKGNITKESGTAIEGAIVTILENGKKAFTDSSGNYEIRGINGGSYTVKVNAAGYAEKQAMVVISDGKTAAQNFSLSSTIGSISGTVKNSSDEPINWATVLAYNLDDHTSHTAQTVAGAFSITELIPGKYKLVVKAEGYKVTVYPKVADPAADGNIPLAAQEDKTGIGINIGEPSPPVFTVNSSIKDNKLSLEFYSNKDLPADPTVSIATGKGSLVGSLTSNSAHNHFEIAYQADASADTTVKIKIEETTLSLIPEHRASKTFTFNFSPTLVQTSSAEITGATGGSASIMGTQDNTEIYVPPFAVAGVENTQAISLTVESYGTPGGEVEGSNDTSISSVYDFHFDQEGITIIRPFTITMSFQLPAGLTQTEFEKSLKIGYFNADKQKWIYNTDQDSGISNIHINWTNSTIMFEVSHLTKFAAFLSQTTGNGGGGGGTCFITTVISRSRGVRVYLDMIANYFKW